MTPLRETGPYASQMLSSCFATASRKGASSMCSLMGPDIAPTRPFKTRFSLPR